MNFRNDCEVLNDLIIELIKLWETKSLPYALFEHEDHFIQIRC